MSQRTLFKPGQYELTDVEVTVIDIVKQLNMANQRVTSKQLQKLTGYSPELIQQATHSLENKGLLLSSFLPNRLI